MDDGTDRPATDPIAAALLAAMAMVEQLAGLILSVKAYREKWEAEGFSPTAAETMAIEFHRFWWRKAAHDAGIGGGAE